MKCKANTVKMELSKIKKNSYDQDSKINLIERYEYRQITIIGEMPFPSMIIEWLR